MKYVVAVFATLMFAAALLPACGPNPGTVAPLSTPTFGVTPSATPMDHRQSTATPTPTRAGGEQVATPTCTPELVLPDEAHRVVQMAKEDLARRLDIPISEISALSVKAVDWPDTSLGCPQPGMAYAQVITPGYLIMLEAKGQAYEYHTDKADQIVLCTTDEQNQPLSPEGIDDSLPWKPVEPLEPDELYPSPEP